MMKIGRNHKRNSLIIGVKKTSGMFVKCRFDIYGYDDNLIFHVSAEHYVDVKINFLTYVMLISIFISFFLCKPIYYLVETLII